MSLDNDDEQPDNQITPDDPAQRVKRASEDTVPRAALIAAFLGSLAFSLFVIFIFVSMKRSATKELADKQQDEVPAVYSPYKTIEDNSFGYLTTRGEEVLIKDAFVRFIPHIPSIFEDDRFSANEAPTKEIQIAIYDQTISQDDRNALRRARLLLQPSNDLPVPLLTVNLTLPANSLTCDAEAITRGAVNFNPAHSIFSNIVDPSILSFDIVPAVLKRNGDMTTSCSLFENGQPLTFYYRHNDNLPDLEEQTFTWNIYFERPLLPLQFLSNLRYQEFAEAIAVWQPSSVLEVAYFHQLLSESAKQKIKSTGNFAANKGIHPDAIVTLKLDDSFDPKKTTLNRDMVRNYKVVFFGNGNKHLEPPPGKETVEYVSDQAPASLSGIIKDGATVTLRVQGRIVEHLDQGMYRLEFALPARAPIYIVEK